MPVFAQEAEQDGISDFIVGSYLVIGKGLESEETYHGKMEISRSAKELRVKRNIRGKTVEGSAAIEQATADGVEVLRIRFSEAAKDFEETCMIGSDLDNYPRITCYLYQPAVATKNPGLEALFRDLDAR